MIINSVKNGTLHNDAIIESLMSIKRAGASAMITYFAMEVAKKIKNRL
jgi:porphobilinogen synthase